ncbi:MAG: hypothetical protein GY702_18765 [Desulfobulbaceae bacterium]|nr:hypothetical protein [Desulfobulbaceae bacterium]
MVETIAVYWEEQVKVYGISHKYDLRLVTLNFPSSELSHWGMWISQLEEQIKRFELVTYHGIENWVTLHLLVDASSANTLFNRVKSTANNVQTLSIDRELPVDVLFLHGPHFQDRFGIIDVAINALNQNKIDLLVSGCAGTSMYLVVPKGNGAKAKEVLKATFIIPTST